MYDNPPPPPGENWRNGLWWNGRYWQTVTQAWPPPAKGTHESDLGIYADLLPGEPGRIGRGGFSEFEAAKHWSRSR